MVKYKPERGDIVWLDFDPQQEKEIQKTRPALVISPLQYNEKTGLALFMPITSQVKEYPFEVLINFGKINGVILSDQIRSLDWKARKTKFVTKVPQSVLEDAMGRLKVLL